MEISGDVDIMDIHHICDTMENGSTWDIRCDLIGCNQWRFINILD
jgi:hypothetical protein